MIDLYSFVGPLIRQLDPERAHGLAIGLLKLGLVPAPRRTEDQILATRVWGRAFANPIGLAAGFDKNAEVPDAMLAQGFGFVEVGSVTPRPQSGNTKPRLFRLDRDEAVVNRMGFNNDGAEIVARRLAARPDRKSGWVGVNLGKNKETDEALDDYIYGIKALAGLSDYIVVNVSSPNTPGLRALQDRQRLAELLQGVRQALSDMSLTVPPPILLKVAPDLTEQDKIDIADVVISQKIDGLIATNTTIDRPDHLHYPPDTGSGGLSGRPLMDPSTRILADFYRLTGGEVVLIGVGGISSGADAYRKIRAGASLVQLYSAMVFHGPGIVARIKSDLAICLRRDGYACIADAVGTGLGPGPG